MSEIVRLMIEYLLFPAFLAILLSLWKDIITRIKSIENRCIRMEKDIVRISTILYQ